MKRSVSGKRNKPAEQKLHGKRRHGSPSTRAMGSDLQVKVLMCAPLVICFLGVICRYTWHFYFHTPADVTKLRAPLVTSIPQFNDAYKDEMLWGTYRPGYYFGMRMRVPQSLLAGVMWFDPAAADVLNNIRHEARDGDALSTYTWTQHDGRSFGTQVLVDGGYNITIAFVKQHQQHADNDGGGGRGGDWAVRVRVRHTGMDAAAATGKRVSLIFYMADEHAPHDTPLHWRLGDESRIGADPSLLLQGTNPTVGDWALHAAATSSSTQKSDVKLHYYAAPLAHTHNLTDYMRAVLYHSMRQQYDRGAQRLHPVLPDAAAGSDFNAAFFQLTVKLPATVDFVFTPTNNAAQQRARDPRQLVGPQLSQLLQQHSREFEDRFDRTFGSFNSTALPANTRTVAHAAMSNLIGGIGYFYGSSLVEVRSASQHEKALVLPYGPFALYTAVPSRSFFPRGFLWDEGFHQLLVQQWDARMSRDIIAHWLDLMNVNGWIPREEILGLEARARVPHDLMIQKPSYANPPSLMLPIMRAAQQLAQQHADHSTAAAEQEEIREWLHAAWPRLKVWFRWFNTTQAGPQPLSYRWRGRGIYNDDSQLNPLTLESGFDDFPRASHPSAIERHVDLRCWMAFAAGAMATIATALQLPNDEAAAFKSHAALLSDVARLNAQHLDATRGWYLDYGNHTEAVILDKVTGRRVVLEPPQPQFVPQFGYVSLFPLMLHLLPPDSAELQQQLDLVMKEDLLWTNFGLRSLARNASLYNAYNTPHSAPYWRSPIWINCNYLVLRALKHYKSSSTGETRSKAAAIYAALRSNLLNNMASQFVSSGYIWENYNDETGQGKGSHPFTGWSALFVAVALESY